MTYRVILKGGEGSIVEELDVAETITPGMLVDRNASGKAIKQVATLRPVFVAEEDDLFGGGLDDNYAVDSRLRGRFLKSGAEFQGLVGAGVAAIAYNAPVMANPAIPGTVITSTGDALTIGYAMQAVNNSGGATAARIRIKVK